MGSYEEQKKNLEPISEYLKKAKISHEFIDITLGEGEKMPAILTDYTYKEFTFDVLMLNAENWIMVQCMILDTTQIPDDVIRDVYELCLELNFDLPETTFSVHNKQIFSEADMTVDVSYDDFINVELNSIAIGIDAFIDTVTAANVEVKDTKGQIKI